MKKLMGLLFLCSCAQMSAQNGNDLSKKLEDLEKRVAALEEKKKEEAAQPGEKEHKKCVGGVCKPIKRRKFHRLKHKRVDPNKPVTLQVCKEGVCKPKGRKVHPWGRRIYGGKKGGVRRHK